MTVDLEDVRAELAPQYARLRQAAKMYEDHQNKRIRLSNQVNSMTVDAQFYAPYVDRAKSDEAELSAILVNVYKEVVPASIRAWQAETPGVGAHMLARLLGHLGHPRLAMPKHWARNATIADGVFGDRENPKRLEVDDPPFVRSVSQVWQYCGHGEPARRWSGMTETDARALGNPECKMVTHLIAEAIQKAQVRTADDGSKYARGVLGDYLLTTKDRYAHRTHSGPCPGGYGSAGGRVVRIRCKHDGHYADKGDPFQPSHVNAIGLRHLGKEVLKQLWIVAEEDWCPDPET